LWLESGSTYGGEESPGDISRGLFAGEVGSQRLLNLFEKYGLCTSWFIPGHSAETFPEQMKASAVTAELLLKKSIKYDHSLMHNDFHPYSCRNTERLSLA
jgi:hypothetical protein